MTQLVDAAAGGAELPESATTPRPRIRMMHPAWWTGGLALVLGAGFVVMSLLWNGGRLFAPLDDVYIHLQYGSQLGAGHFFQFNTGDEISAGASSMLYAFVLGAAYVIGFHGGLLQAFAVVFNLFCFAAATSLTTLAGSRLLGRAAGSWAGALVAVSGPLLWGASSGMEVGLVMLLVTGLLFTVIAEQPEARFRVAPLVAALLALVRPEGLIFAVALTGVVLWALWTHRELSGVAAMLRRAAWSVLPIVVGAGQLLFYKIATGATAANGVQAKSMLYDQPVFYFGEFVDRFIATVRSLFDTFLGYSTQDFTFPGALLIAVAGMAFLLTRRANRPLALGLALGVAAVTVSLSTLDTALRHELRYYQPFMPVFLIFVVAGVVGATRLVRRQRVSRFALHGVLAVALAFSLIAVPMWGVRYARATAAIRDTDVSYAAWIKGNLPADAVVAVKDVGAVAHLGGHRIVDLLGLGTNGLAEAGNNGIGSIYEALRHLPDSERPDYFATYDTGPGPSMAPLRDVGVLQQPEVAAFKAQTPPDLRGIIAVPFKDFTITSTDWSLATNADTTPVPGTLRDRINVSYLDSERGHDWKFLPAQPGLQPWTVLARQDDIIDTGRDILGGEAFTIRNLTPNTPATLTARAMVNKELPAVDVFVDGKRAGTWTRSPQAGPWSTYSFTIPAELITAPAARIELRTPQPTLNPYPDYRSFGYWVTQ